MRYESPLVALVAPPNKSPKSSSPPPLAPTPSAETKETAAGTGAPGYPYGNACGCCGWGYPGRTPPGKGIPA